MPEAYEHASCFLKSHYGEGRLHVYSFGKHEEDNILCIEVRGTDLASNPLVRVQSACYTAEIFRSTDCDCHEQLHESLKQIFVEGGLIVYMLCDGRGAGLLTKVRGLALGDSDQLDTHDAYVRLGVETDPRDYARVAQVLSHRGVQNCRLLTNNPRKIGGLESHGIAVTRVELEIPATHNSLPYLRTKRTKMGHLLDHLKLG
ncbi:GTP cyclohydrolase II [Microbacterium sp. W4I4]|uniref:GTP cyclohydrolase II RibA n=1 Tax=Microbacterium sp. W4I4 TaxID=3042295 RepID=UPI00277FA87C|nr:GTP cyclohydrolase II RibA [Microbacterium sp. W4I4]MDQ0614416.1 GTP cyclohydrolase II [Microbacterium sp. W4I4]